MTYKNADIVNLIAKVSLNFQSTKFKEGDDFFDTGILDSIALVELITVMESFFSIAFNFDDLDAKHFKDIDAIKNLLTQKYGLSFEP